MTKLIVFTCLLFWVLQVHCQNVGIGTSTPDPTSKLEIQTNNSGLLIPRLTTAQRDAIVSPAHALMIYNLTTDCLEIYNANTNVWVPIGCTGCQLPGNFVATAATGLTGTSFTANWTTSFGATSYILEVATDAAFTSYVTGYNNLNVGFVTSYNVTGLTCGVTYYYRVKASNACGITPVTNTISVTLTGGSGTVIFDYISNTYQTWVVPPCVTSITIKAWGAGGGGGASIATNSIAGRGGGGGFVQKILNVNPGDVIQIYVGQGGFGGMTGINSGGANGGWGYGTGGNGGHAGSWGWSGGGGGGGGSTAVMHNSNLIMVAAGGGGGGGNGPCPPSPTDGGQGGAAGQNGGNGNGTGGIAGGSLTIHGTNGGNRGGGDGAGGGGGGGGYNGGTGGSASPNDDAAAGGGGGNSYCVGTGCTIINGSNHIPGNASDANLCTGCAVGGNINVPTSCPWGPGQGNGTNGGHGRVVIIY